MEEALSLSVAGLSGRVLGSRVSASTRAEQPPGARHIERERQIKQQLKWVPWGTILLVQTGSLALPPRSEGPNLELLEYASAVLQHLPPSGGSLMAAPPCRRASKAGVRAYIMRPTGPRHTQVGAGWATKKTPFHSRVQIALLVYKSLPQSASTTTVLKRSNCHSCAASLPTAAHCFSSCRQQERSARQAIFWGAEDPSGVYVGLD